VKEFCLVIIKAVQAFSIDFMRVFGIPCARNICYYVYSYSIVVCPTHCHLRQSSSSSGIDAGFLLYFMKPKRALTSTQGITWRSFAQSKEAMSWSRDVLMKDTSSFRGDQWWVLSNCVCACGMGKERKKESESWVIFTSIWEFYQASLPLNCSSTDLWWWWWCRRIWKKRSELHQYESLYIRINMRVCIVSLPRIF
jgi:hypothetical protein